MLVWYLRSPAPLDRNGWIDADRNKEGHRCRLRWGPGPVFVHESIAATRRWQLYALGRSSSWAFWPLWHDLVCYWLHERIRRSECRRDHDQGSLPALGQYFYYAIATAQLTLVLLVAPAATAGCDLPGPCAGYAHAHVVTDLTDAEIVLGKLARAALAGAFAWWRPRCRCWRIAGLLGGVIFEAIVTLTLITVVLAVFGCSLALAISVRATKTHEVLMAVYGIEGVWVLGPLVWEFLAVDRSVSGRSGLVHGDQSVRAGLGSLCLAELSEHAAARRGPGRNARVSAGLVVYAVLRLRAEVSRAIRLATTRLAVVVGKGCMLARRRGGRRPSLDNDPVLWREWRRGRPSRLARVVWGVLHRVWRLPARRRGSSRLADDYRNGSRIPRCSSTASRPPSACCWSASPRPRCWPRSGCGAASTCCWRPRCRPTGSSWRSGGGRIACARAWPYCRRSVRSFIAAVEPTMPDASASTGTGDRTAGARSIGSPMSPSRGVAARPGGGGHQRRPGPGDLDSPGRPRRGRERRQLCVLRLRLADLA